MKFGEEKEISMQELEELGLPICVAAPLFSKQRLEELIDS